MSTIHQSRRLFFGSVVVFALTLLVPVTVTAEEEVVLAPVAAASVDATSTDAERAAAHALAAERALLSGDIGSLQEEHLRAIMAASTSAPQPRVLAAQQALRTPDLGSLQEEALTATVEASRAEVGS